MNIRSRRMRPWVVALVFLSPLAVFYGVYYVYAFFFLGSMSTKRADLSFATVTDVGWTNFRLVLTDELFLRSVLNNLIFAAVAIGAALTLGFFLAVALSTGLRGHRPLYMVFLLPSLIPLSLVATVVGRMLNERSGAVNETLRDVGLGFLAQNWLGAELPAYVAVSGLFVYLIGLPIMYYTSGLATLNASLLEAAVLDGARTWQLYRSMLFPLLRNTHRTVILSVLLGGFRAFDIVYFSTQGAPGGRTSITGTYIYNTALGGDRVGFAAAASVIVLGVAVLVSAVQAYVVRRRA